MSFQKIQKEVCNEIRFVLSKVDEKEVEVFIDNLLGAKKLFFIGVGRVMFMTKAFAKRLKHLGIDVHVVGEIVEPPITTHDILVVGSGSGETMVPVNMAKLAQKFKAKVGLITSSHKSTLKKLADVSVIIPCPTKLHLPEEPISKQPMGNLFEQSLFILCDCLTIILQKRLGIAGEKMWKTHANLE